MAEFFTRPDAVKAIDNANLLADWFGRWLSFEDAEVTSMVFDRGSRTESADAIADPEPPSLTAIFLVVDTALALDDPRSMPARVSLKFGDILGLQMSGFGWQNPILGLWISVIRSDELMGRQLSVKWGGAAGTGHEVAFRCSTCSVLAVCKA